VNTNVHHIEGVCVITLCHHPPPLSTQFLITGNKFVRWMRDFISCGVDCRPQLTTGTECVLSVENWEAHVTWFVGPVRSF